LAWFDEDEVEWFKEKACEVVKVGYEVGDLIVSDSRTMHYNALPEGHN
jgi:hypothetical protein